MQPVCLNDISQLREVSKHALLSKQCLFVFRPAMLHKRSLCRRAVSVCPSVCPSRSCILSKRINVSSFSQSGSFTVLDYPYQTLWQYSDGYP